MLYLSYDIIQLLGRVPAWCSYFEAYTQVLSGEGKTCRDKQFLIPYQPSFLVVFVCITSFSDAKQLPMLLLRQQRRWKWPLQVFTAVLVLSVGQWEL